jgi:hypothetical protein
MALKLFKTPASSENYTINLSNILGSSTISSISLTYSIPSDLVIANTQINSSLLNGVIQPGKAIQMDISGGQTGFEYTIIARYTTSLGATKDVSVVICVLDQIPLALDYYGSVYLADTYFNNVLGADVWLSASNPNKRKALITASLFIDRFDYAGDKTDETQLLSFPRDGSYEVPIAINYATFELAQVLLSGKGPQDIAASIPVKRDRFGNVETEYDPRYTPDFLLNSMPSFAAWTYVKPYLRSSQFIQFARTS